MGFNPFQSRSFLSAQPDPVPVPLTGLEPDLMSRFLSVVATAALVVAVSAGSAFAQETMECLGGNGYVEEQGEGVMARIYREMPLNSIWEGAGNIMALDLMRALRGHDVADLDLSGTEVDKLDDLRGVSLRRLNLRGTPATDLAILRGMPLEEFVCGEQVSDLAPLRGMRLKVLDLVRSNGGVAKAVGPSHGGGQRGGKGGSGGSKGVGERWERCDGKWRQRRR
jgi:hypothetical protein